MATEESGEATFEQLLASYVDRLNRGEMLEREAIEREHPAEARELIERLEVFEAFGGGRGSELGTLGDYKLLREIGRGGMGVVYEAIQVPLNRRVALKTLPSALLPSPRALARFQHEARVASSLEHPGICRVYDAGVEEGVPYIAMQYIEGEPLAQRIKTAQACQSTGQMGSSGDLIEALANGCGKPMTPSDQRSAQPTTKEEMERILRLVERAARALHIAHEAGFVHRDIKPGNIMVDKDGAPVILDFGLARDIEGEQGTITLSGELLGTPAYMSPEQIAASRIKVDRRTDVYSLGVTLYECLTLKLPFDAPTREGMFQKIIGSDPPDPRTINRRISKDLKVVLETVLEKDLNRRYQTALDLAEDLRSVRQNEPIHARPAGPVVKFTRLVKRHPVAAMSTFGLILLLATGLSIALVMLREVDEARKVANQNLYRSLVREAGAIRLARQIGFRTKAWDRLRQALALDDPEKDRGELRREAVASMGDFRGLEPMTWDQFGSPNQISSLAVNPEGTRAAVGLGGSRVSIRDVVTGKEVDTVWGERVDFGSGSPRVWTQEAGGKIEVRMADGHGGWARTNTLDVSGPLLEVAPDGAHFLVREGSNCVSLWHLQSEKKLSMVTADGPVVCAALSPDRRWLAVGCDDADIQGLVQVWELRSDEAPRSLECVEPRAVTFSSDSTLLATLPYNGGATVYDTVTLQRVGRVPGYTCTAVAFSHDGKHLALGSVQLNAVSLWDFAGNRRVAVLSHPASPPWVGRQFIAFDRRGTTLLTGGHQSVCVWRLYCTREMLSLAGHRSGVAGLAFSPDGKNLASISKDRTVKIWDPGSGELLQTLNGLPGPGQCVGFSPDGSLLATGDYELGAIWIWDVRSGKRVLTLENTCGPSVWTTAFSPDGRHFGACGAGGVEVWRMHRERNPPRIHMELVETPKAGYTEHLCFSPDGRLVAWMDFWGRTNASVSSWGQELDYNQLVVWDLEHSRVVATPPRSGIDPIQGAAFFSDSCRVVFVTVPRIAEVWNVRREEMVSFFDVQGPKQAHESYTCKMALSPDGRTLAVLSISAQGVNLWDAATGAPLLSLPEREGTVWYLAWSPDSKRLAVARADGEIEIWNLPEVHSQLVTLGLDVSDEDRKRPPTVAAAGQLVEDHLDRHGFSPDVIDALAENEELDPTVRELAVRVAQGRIGTPWFLYVTSRWILQQSDRSASENRRALQMIERACRMAPGNHEYLTELAIAYHKTDSGAKASAAVDKMLRIVESTVPSIEEAAGRRIRIPFPALARLLPWLDAERREKLLRLGDRVQDMVTESAWEPERVVKLIPRDSEWHYFDTGKDLGRGWRGPEFDHGGWKRGPAPLGYGATWLATTLDFGNDESNKHVTTYFRRRFRIEQPDRFQSLKIRLLYDDGAAVYINGQEVVRNSLAEAAPYDELSSGGGPGEEGIYLVFPIRADVLVSGENTIAVEIHQWKRTSSDVVFDLVLEGLLAETE